VINQEMLNLIIYQLTTKKKRFLSIKNKKTTTTHFKREESLQGGRGKA